MYSLYLSVKYVMRGYFMDDAYSNFFRILGFRACVLVLTLSRPNTLFRASTVERGVKGQVGY